MQKIATNFVIKADDGDSREIDFIASKQIKDRDNEVVAISGIDLKNYKQNPVVLWSHDPRQPPIGKATKVTKSGDELKVKIQFAAPEEYSFADTIFKLVKGGYLNTLSIGFIPDFKQVVVNEKAGTRTYNAVELCEISVVPIPSNTGAVALRKALDDEVIDEVELKEFELYCKESAIEEKTEKIEKKEEILETDLKKDISSVSKELEFDKYCKSIYEKWLNEDSFDAYVGKILKS